MTAQVIPFRLRLAPMPKTRGDCIDGPRPCPHHRCRHNLVADTLKDGTVRFHWSPADEPWRASCALDEASNGPMVAEAVADAMGISRERVRQLEESALRRLKRRVRGEDYR